MREQCLACTGELHEGRKSQWQADFLIQPTCLKGTLEQLWRNLLADGLIRRYCAFELGRDITSVVSCGQSC